MPSFDIESKVDQHELTNAIDQANRVIGNRFDFKGTDSEILQNENKITLKSQQSFQIDQMLPILKESLAKRGIDIKCLSDIKFLNQTDKNPYLSSIDLKGLPTVITKFKTYLEGGEN